jgi:hypothetical protein
MNHRMGKRIEITHPVVLDVGGLGRMEGRLKNISISGAAVICKDVYLLDTYLPLNLSFQVMDGRQTSTMIVEGFVVRLKGELIGIMFMQDMIGLAQRLWPDVEEKWPRGGFGDYVYSNSH